MSVSVPRLQAIASLVREGVRIADVGCDHGILITSLLESGKICGGIACDINELPLKKARIRVSMMGMQNAIECRISDGLANINEHEVEDIVIAGMGAELIARIISECRWHQNKNKRFILQPMTKAPYLRGWLLDNGFEIVQEIGCCGKNKYYTAIQATYSDERKPPKNRELYLLVGELLKNPNAEAKRVINMTANGLEKRGIGLQKNDPQTSKKLLEQASELRSMTLVT